MKPSNEQTLKEVLNEFINSFNMNDKINEIQITENWSKIMGEFIAKHTINLFLKDKTLYITLDSAALRQELSYAKTKVLNMLNKELGSKVLKDIIFR